VASTRTNGQGAGTGRRREGYGQPPGTQKLERELTEVATKYSLRAQKLERELTETATRYSQWGQKLKRELARTDPNGAPARRFDAQDES
jgi:hypothetical protein